MINLNVLIGEPIPFLKHTKIYPPTIRNVAQNPAILSEAKLFLIEEEDILEILKGNTENIPTPFEFLLINAFNSIEFLETLQQSFIDFIHTRVTFLFNAKKIVLMDLNSDLKGLDNLESLDILEEDNFDDFCQKIAESINYKRVKKEPLSSNPAVARIQLKARERDRIKAKQKDHKSTSLETCLVAICCMGIGITPLNIGEMSYASIQSILKMMQDKEKYELDIKSLLAGADSKKIKPVYWIKND